MPDPGHHGGCGFHAGHAATEAPDPLYVPAGFGGLIERTEEEGGGLGLDVPWIAAGPDDPAPEGLAVTVPMPCAEELILVQAMQSGTFLVIEGSQVGRAAGPGLWLVATVASSDGMTGTRLTAYLVPDQPAEAVQPPRRRSRKRKSKATPSPKSSARR